MATILVNTNNVHRDEVKELKKRLTDECWLSETLTYDELKCLDKLVFDEFHKFDSGKASKLSDTDLIILRNKLIKFLP